MGIEEESKIDFTIYPNPASDFVIVSYESQSGNPYNLSVFDELGRQILIMKNLPADQLKLDTKGWSAGTYLILFKDKTRVVHSDYLMIH